MEKTEKENKESYKKLLFFHGIANFLFNTFRFPGSRALSRVISKLFLSPLKDPISCPTIYGFDILLHNEKNSEIHEIYNLGFYEAGTLNVNKSCLREGDVFIDVGASIGLMSLHASNIVGAAGKVVAFEPTPKSFEVFSKSIEMNGMKNIFVNKTGLGNETKSIPIYTDRACPSMVSAGRDEPHEMVKIDRLDDVLERERIPPVRMMKIDVEGFELEVLRGAEKLLSGKNAPIICLEYMKALIKDESDDAISYLKRINKYNFFQLEKSKNTISKLRKVEGEEEFRNDDNIFCFLETHLVSVSKNLFIK